MAWFENDAINELDGSQSQDNLFGTRIKADRRGFSWRTVLFGFFRSRRRDKRRYEDDDPIYTDWHHPWLFFLATGIMLMSSADAFLTLQLIDLGAIEINPVMAHVMGKSTLTFAISKLALTAFGIFVLVFLSKSRFLDRFRTGLVLTAFFSFYAALICYEFVNLVGRL